ncbi:MAG: response regulator [Deltaproteobacteria bacterium]|nr:response regulator [Deltaproteobacteria bacterium]
MTATPKTKPIEILLVEDNPGDVELAKDAFESSKVCNRLYAVSDGVEAMEFLKRQGRFHTAPRPGLVLLDLNLPRMDGRELLAAIKSDDDLKRIPVVILTTSREAEDVLRTYNLHANCYITKPIELSQFLRVVQSIEDFWLTVATLPNGAAA